MEAFEMILPAGLIVLIGIVSGLVQIVKNSVGGLEFPIPGTSRVFHAEPYLAGVIGMALVRLWSEIGLVTYNGWEVLTYGIAVGLIGVGAHSLSTRSIQSTEPKPQDAIDSMIWLKSHMQEYIDRSEREIISGQQGPRPE